MIYLIGEVNDSMVKKVAKALDNPENPTVNMTLCSGGGYAYAALAIAGMIKFAQDNNVKVTILGTGMVQSAAVLILASAKVRRMTRGTWAMVHEESATYKGATAEILRSAEQAQREENNWNMLMEQFTTTTSAQWDIMSRKTTYLTADECLNLGLIDEIV